VDRLKALEVELITIGAEVLVVEGDVTREVDLQRAVTLIQQVGYNFIYGPLYV